jgi:hypothetical protein
MSNTFYLTVVTNKSTDACVGVHSYTKIGPAKARRTNTMRFGGGIYDAKVFKCLYGLGCMTAVELELPEVKRR